MSADERDDGTLCQYCGCRYRVDLMLTDDAWNAIRGSYNLLCGKCIVERLETLHRKTFGAYLMYNIACASSDGDSNGFPIPFDRIPKVIFGRGLKLAEEASVPDLKLIRQAVADYICSEGCGCCEDELHKRHGVRLGKLLKMEDEPSSYRTKEEPPADSCAAWGCTETNEPHTHAEEDGEIIKEEEA